MKNVIPIVALLLSLTLSHGSVSQLWENDRLTQSQPFPGKVMAVESSWGGCRLLIESLGAGEKKYCVAQIWPAGYPHLEYKEIEQKDLKEFIDGFVHLSPSIDISRFSWSIGIWKIGKIFGDDDCLVLAIKLHNETLKRQKE